MRNRAITYLAATALLSGLPVAVYAQGDDLSRLMGMSIGSLESEIQSRYNDGLAASLNEAIIAADDPRYLWALETKVQCGIALGFLKSETKDETSIGNCLRAHGLMNYIAPPPPPPPVVQAPPPAPPPAICSDDIPGIVFFEFDSAVVEPEAQQTLQTVVTNIPVCGWNSLGVVGHTDQAGSDAYNVGLSEERANAVANALRGLGVSDGTMTISFEGESNPRVPLEDGMRSPENRRVELHAN